MALENIARNTGAAILAPVPELTEEEFHLFQALILRESGIHLGA
jgi:hypothetical protein